ncbi:MAG: cyclic nucleotide-binding domain-containing protein [Pseudomonadota bacterium]
MTSIADKYNKRLQLCIPINSFDKEVFDRLKSAIEFQQYKEKQEIFSIGDDDIYSLFLLDGEIELFSKDGKQTHISIDNKQSLHAIAALKPRLFDAHATTDNVLIAKIPTETLNKLLIWDQGSSSVEVSDISISFNESDNEWKMSMLQTEIFLTLPAANIMSLFDKMETIDVIIGEEIITQGDPADYYYMIKEGFCQVSRTFQNNTEAIILNELGPTDCFGEEAIVSGDLRNASIIMTSDGKLVRLAKEQFHSLLEEPLLKWVDNQQTKQLIQDGAIPIDVRTEDEFANSGINNTTNIPLYLLRLKIQNLDKNSNYVLFCDTGSRSSAAAFLMAQAGFKNVFILKNGLHSQG